MQGNAKFHLVNTEKKYLTNFNYTNFFDQLLKCLRIPSKYKVN